MGEDGGHDDDEGKKMSKPPPPSVPKRESKPTTTSTQQQLLLEQVKTEKKQPPPAPVRSSSQQQQGTEQIAPAREPSTKKKQPPPTPIRVKKQEQQKQTQETPDPQLQLANKETQDVKKKPPPTPARAQNPAPQTQLVPKTPQEQGTKIENPPTQTWEDTVDSPGYENTKPPRQKVQQQPPATIARAHYENTAPPQQQQEQYENTSIGKGEPVNEYTTSKTANSNKEYNVTLRKPKKQGPQPPTRSSKQNMLLIPPSDAPPETRRSRNSQGMKSSKKAKADDEKDFVPMVNNPVYKANINKSDTSDSSNNNRDANDASNTLGVYENTEKRQTTGSFIRKKSNGPAKPKSAPPGVPSRNSQQPPSKPKAPPPEAPNRQSSKKSNFGNTLAVNMGADQREAPKRNSLLVPNEVERRKKPSVTSTTSNTRMSARFSASYKNFFAAGAAAPKAVLDEDRWRNVVKKLVKDSKKRDEEEKELRYLYGAEYSLYCLHFKHPFRIMIHELTSSRLFENVILFVILLNCIVLAATDPTEEENPVLEGLEYMFLAIFSIEMLLKIIARGFVRYPHTYLRDPWNILDFVIVLSGYIDIIVRQAFDFGGADLKALRALRVLRSLRVIQGVPSLQHVMESIMLSIPHLNNVGGLIMAIIVFYGIVGVELFGGKMGYKCVYNASNIVVDDRPCVLTGMGHYCNTNFGEICLKRGNPNNGITSFDNIGVAMLTVFQCLTLEGWAQVWYFTEDSVGSEWPWIYFVSLVIIGSFLVLNLVLGILYGQFSKADFRTKFRVKVRKNKAKKKFQDRLSQIKEYSNWIMNAEDGGYLQSIAQNGALGTDEFHEESEDDDCEDDDVVLDDTLIDATDPGGIRPWHIRLDAIVRHPAFVACIMFLVLVNTCLLASDHANQSETWSETLRYANIAFVVVYFLELLLKLYALGPNLYWRFGLNRYDCFVVVVSGFEIIIMELFGAPNLGLSVLRSIRLVRVLRYTSWWRPLRALVVRLVGQFKVIGSLMALLQLLIVVFSLLGMQIFGGRFESQERTNFDNFWRAYLTVFQVLTGENWNEIMFEAIDSSGGINSWGSLSCIYFIILVIVGKYVVLNVFLAIAVDCLDVVLMTIKEIRAERKAEKERKLRHKKNPYGEDTKIGDTIIHIEEGDNVYEINDVVALGCFSPQNGFRMFCYKVTKNRFFAPFILFCIVASSIILAAEDPTDLDAPRNKVLNVFDYIFTGIFFVEMCLKIVSKGLYSHPKSYLRSNWNIMDMFIVITSIVGISVEAALDDNDNGSILAVRMLRTLRVLRPLRTIETLPKLKQVVVCLMDAIPNMQGIIIITVTPIFIFGIIGVSLFKGAFNFCDVNGENVYLSRALCVGNATLLDPVTNTTIFVQRNIENSYNNFDNIAVAMQTLFSAATTEGWAHTLYNTIDSVHENSLMELNIRPAAGLYLVIYMLIVSFFLLNLFIGFVIVTYQDATEEDFDGCVLDKGDRECVMFVLNSKPRRSYKPGENASSLRKWCFQFSNYHENPKFDWVIMGAIIANIVVLMMNHHPMSWTFAVVIYIANILFTIVFLVEAIIKMTALGVRGYFASKWNRFDFIIVIAGIVDVIVDGYRGFHDDRQASSPLDFIRVFRALRLIKLLKTGNIKLLLNTFLRSFAELPYVMLLVLLLFFVYAVVGMQIFGRLEESHDREINSQVNFSSFWHAMALLFRVSTGEGWDEVMDSMELRVGRGECDRNPPDGQSTCGNGFARFYMITFVVLSTFIILNLFVAVIVDNFDFLTRDESELGTDALEEFVSRWTQYDPEATGKITHTELRLILMEIETPFGLKGCPNFIINAKLKQVDCPLDPQGSENPERYPVEFHSAFMALVKCQKGAKKIEKLDFCERFNRSIGCKKKSCYKRHACANCLSLGHGAHECTADEKDVVMSLSWKHWPNEKVAETVKKYLKVDSDLVDKALPPLKTLCHHAEAGSNDPCVCMMSIRSYYSILRLQQWWRRRYQRFEFYCADCHHRFKTKENYESHLNPTPQSHIVDRQGGHSTLNGKRPIKYTCNALTESTFGIRKRTQCNRQYLTQGAADHCTNSHKHEKLLCEPCGIDFIPLPAAHPKRKTKCLSQAMGAYEVCVIGKPCSWCSEEAYKQLERHCTRVHRKDESRWPLTCLYCNRRFMRRKGLKLHLRQHTKHQVAINL
eukprot:m.8605 g.8605  ORF g.8605 m.8605 type:complete len:2172 (+) comp3929_c0_seq1:301-6816(+)